MNVWKCCTQYASKFGKLSSGHRTGKGQFSFQTQGKAVPKNAMTFLYYDTIALISHASKVMLKILQARLQQYMNHELPDVQAGFRTGRGSRDQIANICWNIIKTREFQKNIYFYFIDFIDKNKRVPGEHLFLLYWLWLCGSEQTVENSLRDGTSRPPDLPLEKPVYRSGSNS